MKVQVRAEYACGHDPRIICSKRIMGHHISRGIREMVEEVTEENVVSFNCHCGRGCAYVELIVDGKIISRTPAAHFMGKPGCRGSFVKKEID